MAGCDILPDGKLVIAVQKGKRLLMFSNNGNYEKDIVRFSGIPFEVSYTGENIVADSRLSCELWCNPQLAFL
jgi:hypothetical protein